MPALKRYLYWELELPGRKLSGGSRSSPVETDVGGYALTGEDVQLATSTALTIWTSANAVADFDFFYLLSDQDLKIEVTCDRGGEVGSEEFVFIHPANVPFVLQSDDALALYSGTLSGGTEDVVDEIVVRNESGSTASIDYALIT